MATSSRDLSVLTVNWPCVFVYGSVMGVPVSSSANNAWLNQRGPPVDNAGMANNLWITCCGEGGIRTHDGCYPISAFQADALGQLCDLSLRGTNYSIVSGVVNSRIVSPTPYQIDD